MIKSIYIRSSRHFGIDVYGKSPFEIGTLAWPLILQWRRESAKHGGAELSVVLPDNRGWTIDIKNIKRDALVDFIHQNLWGK